MFQTKAGRGSNPGRYNPAALGAAEKGRHRTGCHVPHLSQDQICGRHRPYVQLLQYSVLCSLWRQSHPSLQQGQFPLTVYSIHIMDGFFLFVYLYNNIYQDTNSCKDFF